MAEHRDQELADVPQRDVDAFVFGLNIVFDRLAKLRRESFVGPDALNPQWPNTRSSFGATTSDPSAGSAR